MIAAKLPEMTTRKPTGAEYRLAFSQFVTGVTVVTAERAPGRVHGMTANSFTSVSLDPLLVSVCVARQAHLLPLISAKRRFGVSVLKQEQQAVSRYFAQPEESTSVEEKLGIRFRWTESGIPLLKDALVHFACNVVGSYMAGDHTIFLAEVESVEVFDGEPLLYFRSSYRSMGS